MKILKNSVLPINIQKNLLIVNLLDTKLDFTCDTEKTYCRRID